MMYGYNPNCGAMMAPEYMQQQPWANQKPMMQQSVQPMTIPAYPAPNCGGQMGQVPMPIPAYPGVASPIQQVPYPTYPTPTPSYPGNMNQAQPMPIPAYPNANYGGQMSQVPMPLPASPCCGNQIQPMPIPVPVYPKPSCGCGGGQPVVPVMPQPQPQPQYPMPLMVEEPIMTTTNYKKTTYMEAYVPVETDVPLLQNVVETKPTKPMAVKPVATPEYTVNNYDMYLGQVTDRANYMQERAVAPVADTQIVCHNLPLAQSYVQPQTYVNFNDPETTLEQATYFSDLYRPYTGGRL